MSQNICNILVMWGEIQQLRMLLEGLWGWQTHLNSEMPNSLGTPRELFAGISTVDWSTASESSVLNLPDLWWSSRFLQPEQNFWNHLIQYCEQLPLHFLHHEYSWLLPECNSPVQTHKASVADARSSAQLSNHTWSEAMLNVSAHYLPQWVLTMVWNA